MRGEPVGWLVQAVVFFSPAFYDRCEVDGNEECVVMRSMFLFCFFRSLCNEILPKSCSITGVAVCVFGFISFWATKRCWFQAVVGFAMFCGRQTIFIPGM